MHVSQSMYKALHSFIMQSFLAPRIQVHRVRAIDN